MDVRSADTANLAAKRLEMEKVQPVTQKPRCPTEDELAACAADEADGLASRPRSPKVRRDKRDDDAAKHANERNEQSLDGVESQEQPDAEAGQSEHHILDVRV